MTCIVTMVTQYEVKQDLSKNRLCELPEELCQFISLETLVLYHNCIRSLTPILCHLQALTYLNLSRNLISNLPPSVCQLPLLRVLIVSNNKLSALPASIHTLTHLRQLDVSCNDLQCLPVELGQLECLRDLNLRRNRLTTLPEELSELPLVRLDVSCNHISHVPVCYRHLRQLQTIVLDNNPLQQPPAQVCSKGKYHIFKFLNIEACKRNQEELERALRPTGFNSCVDSGSKRWSGNESADDFSERSLRMAELTRDQRNLEEEVEAEEDSPLTETPNRVNGEAEQVVSIDCSVTEEEEEECRTNHPTPPLTAPPQEKTKKSSPPPQTQDTSISRSSISVEVGGCGGRPLPPSSPTLEERRRPGTLLIWQERERAQQQKRDHRARDNGLLKTTTAKTGSHVATLSQTGSSSSVGSPDNRHSQNSFRQRYGPSSPMASSPPGLTQKPNSFLFRTSSRCSVKSQVSISGSTQSPLANHVRPRAVSIIHIPSPAVPKLSTAKCRLNVENFIAACRKLGVPETEVCVYSDVFLCKLPAVLRCVAALTVTPHPPHLSLVSEGFLVFYCLVMALIYTLYYHLVA
ncbi:unnamed protein product [Coregonus sp. 'balchen']|nr:unnamed protein product [Coregonus sp. 'balchen']